MWISVLSGIIVFITCEIYLWLNRDTFKDFFFKNRARKLINWCYHHCYVIFGSTLCGFAVFSLFFAQYMIACFLTLYGISFLWGAMHDILRIKKWKRKGTLVAAELFEVVENTDGSCDVVCNLEEKRFPIKRIWADPSAIKSIDSFATYYYKDWYYTPFDELTSKKVAAEEA